MWRTLYLSVILAAASGVCTVAGAFNPAPDLSLAGAGAGLPTARFFGQSVSANGQNLAVGAPGSAALGAPGSVWVYTRNGDDYTLLNVLQAPSPAAGDGFGQHVQFSGTSLIVGAPFRTVSGVSRRGEVYIYNLVAGQYTLAQTLVPGVALAQDDWFGFHLSADVGWLAVGVPRAGLNDEGQVQLYRYDGNLEAWVYHSAIDSALSNIRLGIRVLTRGTRVLVSAVDEFASPNTLSRGYVYEYLRSGNGAAATFAQAQKFRSSVQIVDSPQAFGSALALSDDGTQLLVGAPFDLEADSDQRGAAFAFTRVGGQWVQAQRIASPAGAPAENFGASIAFNGNNRVLIGDFREAFGSAGQVGAVHQYDLTGNIGAQNWVLSRSWLRGAGTDQDFFGNALTFSDGHLIVGSSGHNDGANADVGRVYVYSAVFRNGFE